MPTDPIDYDLTVQALAVLPPAPDTLTAVAVLRHMLATLDATLDQLMVERRIISRNLDRLIFGGG